MKKIIRIEGVIEPNFTGDNLISDIEEYLEEMKKLGHTNIVIYHDYFIEDICLLAHNERLETDEEYETRLSLEQSKLNEIEQAEIALMKRLKEKYEK